MKVKSLAVSDLDLIQQYQNGDERSFEILLNKYKSKIYTSILVVIKDEDTSNDIFQDTFIKVIDKLLNGQYNEEGKFLPWVLRIAHNLCMDHFRKNQKEAIHPNNNPEFDILDSLSIADESNDIALDLNDENINILKYIDLLPEEQREVVILRHYYDYSFKQIAEMTGTNINTSLGRMRYALINLRKYIEKQPI